MQNQHIPMVDLSDQYRKFGQEIFGKWKELCSASSFILGEEVEKFEEEFAAFCSRKYAIAVCSGTSALHLALEASGCRGGEVITPPFTFIATSEAVIHSGAKIKWVDIESETYCIDPGLIEESITSQTKALLPVHLYGCSAEMDTILEIARRRKLAVIEDCAQSHGALYKGKKSGSMGDVACFSFYPGKNLGAYGDAGCIVCDDKNTADTIRRLRNHGSAERYYHTEIGYNYRMDSLQAAVLRIKLKHLEEWSENRRRNARLYSEALDGLPVTLPSVPERCSHVFHQYVILAPERDRLAEKLALEGISTAVHYPVPLHMQPCFSFMGFALGDFPAAEKISESCISLPMYPELSETQIEYICSKVKEYYG